ncbi:MAG: hypothetical protein LBJ17_03970, partial [Dysgonamonadaceae bacterium]|nr:hypothetical protein [Dysgonamonadaceae bacterium]
MKILIIQVIILISESGSGMNAILLQILRTSKTVSDTAYLASYPITYPSGSRKYFANSPCAFSWLGILS